MKSKRVLIGLIVAAFVGGAHVAYAQPKANYQNDLIEIGPDNVGGRVRAIVVDQSEPNHRLIYAGGVAGGLYSKYYDENWQFIPCTFQGQDLTLPISHMVQLPDNSLLIATGEGIIPMHGVNNDRMSPKGHGIFRFNPADYSFTRMAATDPDSYPEWSYINRLAFLERDGYLYLYAATNEGLYRWKLNASNPDWNATPSLVVEGNFQDVLIISADNIAYATAPGKLYRIGNVTGQSAAVDITTANSAFGNSTRIELAGGTAHTLDSTTGAYTHTTYVYALVSDTAGLLEGVYLTNNQQNWRRLSTATVYPFTLDCPGYLNSAITMNPKNYKQIVIGGEDLYVGEGLVEGGLYQWTVNSLSENSLTFGNYMGNVYSNPAVVHSGIHQIVATWEINNDGDTVDVQYIATDGGVYKTDVTTGGFISLNKGFNTTQFNHIAVTPDGSIIGGAVDNGCPFIQTRNDHNGSVPTNSWYDDDTASVLNHMANILWFGNGGGVAASMFQQLTPFTRRSFIVSAEPGNFSYINDRNEAIPVASFGRACTDYADFYNTQTWTIGDAFLSNMVLSSNPIPQVKLWETTNNTIWNDKITFTIDVEDTNLTYIHNGQTTRLTAETNIVPGDQILVASKANFDYPFYHTFDESFTVKNKLTHTITNKVISRVIVNGKNILGQGTVALNLTPNYYRNSWNINDANSTDPAVLEKLMHWVNLYVADAGYSVGNIAFSRDGLSVYINVINDSTGNSFILHMYDFEKTDVNNIIQMKTDLSWSKDYPGCPRITHFDTIFAADGTWFKRPVTSIAVDPRDGQDNLIVTFGGYQFLEPNMVYIKNAGNATTRTVTNMSIIESTTGIVSSDPVYSALIECTTGAVYAGTEKGVFASASANNPVWRVYGSFNGVPVTSIVQQTHALPRIKYTVRDGVNHVDYLFAKTKYPYAIYFGTYGRGVFMDSTYVTDHVNEVCDPEDFVGITTVDKGENHVKVYPNPAVDKATAEITVFNAGNAVVKVYDINGRMVYTEQLGYLSEGVHNYSIDCSKLGHGMYLVNINLGSESATSKLIVR